MLRGRRATATVALTLVATTGVVYAVASRGEEVERALRLFPLWALFVCAGLHLVTLIARSEAWRIALAAIEDRKLSRHVVHSANAGAYCAGALMAHTSLPVRIALLRRLAREDSPRVAQIVVTDLPIFLFEVFWACSLVAVTREPLALPLALLLLVVAGLIAHLLEDRPAARGLAVLTHPRRRLALGAWVGVITLATTARLWLILALLLLPAQLPAVGTAFASLGALGLIPAGPASQAAGGATVAGEGALGAGLAAGLVFAASALIAVFVYAAVLAAVTCARSLTATSPAADGSRFGVRRVRPATSR